MELLKERKIAFSNEWFSGQHRIDFTQINIC